MWTQHQLCLTRKMDKGASGISVPTARRQTMEAVLLGQILPIATNAAEEKSGHFGPTFSDAQEVHQSHENFEKRAGEKKVARVLSG